MRGKKDEIELLHTYGIYPSKRLVALHGEIDEDTTREVCGNLMALDFSAGAITLIMNTSGGSVYDGMAIYDTIKSCKNPVTMIGIGQIMSMGPIILQAAHERILSTNCRILLHYGTDGFEGNALDMVKAGKEAEFLMRDQERLLLAKIKEKNPRFTRAKLRPLLAADHYMSAQDAVKLGLADKVVGDA